MTPQLTPDCWLEGALMSTLSGDKRRGTNYTIYLAWNLCLVSHTRIEFRNSRVRSAHYLVVHPR